jgi:non-heme chloroperoxidase
MKTHYELIPTHVPAETASSRRAFLTSAAVLGAGLVAGCQNMAATKTDSELGPGKFKTSDGAVLNYIEAGKGKPLVMIPGWSQTAAMYKHQIAAFSTTHRVIAVDMRGHGDSSKPPSGYRIARLSRDLHEFLEGMRLNDVILAGHSMGCSVIWSYWDQYGGERLSKLVLIDEAPAVVYWPGWSDEQKKLAGAVFDPKGLFDTCASLAGPDGVQTTAGLVNGLFFTKNFSQAEKDWVLLENLKMPRESAARLLSDHCVQDWRDTIPRINIPTIVFGGTGSFFTPASQEWIHRQIPGSLVEIFTTEEGGSHFMFMENPAKFNRLLAEFLA